MFAALCAAIIHDYNHPGINNNFHIKYEDVPPPPPQLHPPHCSLSFPLPFLLVICRCFFLLTLFYFISLYSILFSFFFSPLCCLLTHTHTHRVQTYLATLFNDRSILENIHVSSVFELMKMPKYNILQGFNDEQRRDIRETLVEMVLATDMGLHAKILGTFKRRLVEDHEFKKKDDIRLALSMAVKMADISNCGRDQKLYLGWCNQIADEFYMQGDRERNLGFPCSPFMDRFAPAMAKGQIAFMNYIVVPLFECISEFLKDMHFSVDMTEENKAHWTQNDDS